MIEVALPLEAINKESARESLFVTDTLQHLWWSGAFGLPGGAFASLVDDPGEYLERPRKKNAGGCLL